jgi:peptide/nickel transport system permease protein
MTLDIDAANNMPRGSVRDPKHVSERRQARIEKWHLLRRRPSFVFGTLISLFWVMCALFGTAIAPKDPENFRGKVYLSPRADHWFGTDSTGRDVFSRVIVGSRDVLSVAPAAALISVVLGVFIGLLIGYFGGWLDLLLGRILDGIVALPAILIGLLAVTMLGNSAPVVVGVVAAIFTPIVARSVRAAVLAERDLDYVTSARLRGESAWFIMFREVLPNIWGVIVVELTIRVGYAIFTIATLAFLGAGPLPPSPDWGAQVADTYAVDIPSGFWWTTIFPSMAIASLVIAVNLIADAVQAVIED